MKWFTCVVLFCVTAVLADEDWLDVTTSQGPVRGRRHPKADVYAFYNIPYATAPVGVNKFKVLQLFLVVYKGSRLKLEKGEIHIVTVSRGKQWVVLTISKIRQMLMMVKQNLQLRVDVNVCFFFMFYFY